MKILKGKRSETDRDGGEANNDHDLSEYNRVKKVVRRQALLAIGTLVLVVVLLFAMTSAWYTNVSKASALTFRTEAWGFDTDNIIVADTEILCAPGKSGVIPLRIDNSDSGDGVTLYVTISKAPMGDEELRRRIYFYADTSMRINDENVSRVYLGSTDENLFSYDVLPGCELIMSDEYYNDIPIKWEWVYDSEGYYFRGTVTGSSVLRDEYLRPIEYDLDKATFDLYGAEPSGRLLTVNGVSVDDFLAELSQTDGYEGVIDPAHPVVNGSSYYFPVAVDANGTGVWAYLSNYGEIERDIEYDTSFSEEAREIVASLNISAVNIPSRTEMVSTGEQLWNALRSEDVEVVELTSDVELSSPISVINGADAMIDLNGFSVTYTGSESLYSAFVARNGAKLTVINGDLIGNGNGSGREGVVSSIAFETIGGDVTLSNVNVTGFDSAVYVSDYVGTGEDSIVKIYHCDLDTINPTVFFMGNGEASEAPSRLIIQDSRINSRDYAGISGQGSTNRWGTDIVILDSEISGHYAAYFQPQQKSNTLICRSELSGITGMALKGGTVRIVDSSVTGTGPHVNAASTGNGWTDTGDGVYVEAAYNWNVTVSIDGTSEIVSRNSYAVEMVGKDGAGKGKVVINNGRYTGALGAVNWNEIGDFSIYGGNFGSGAIPDSIKRYDTASAEGNG